MESTQVAALRPHSGVEVYLRMRPQLLIPFWDLKLLVGSSGQRYLENLQDFKPQTHQTTSLRAAVSG